MLRVGKDLIDHPVTIPLTCAGTSPTRPGYSRPYPAWLWTLSGLGASTTSLGSLSSISPNFISFSLYPLVLVIPLQFLTKPLSGLPEGPLQILEGCNATYSSLGWTTLSACLCRGCTPILFVDLIWTCLDSSMSSLCWEHQNCTQYSRGSHKSTGAKHLMRDKIKLQNPAHRRQSRFSASLRHPYTILKSKYLGFWCTQIFQRDA